MTYVIQKVGTEFQVNTQTAGNSRFPAIATLANGGFVTSWQDNSGTLGDIEDDSIKAQIFDSQGVRVGGEFLVNTQTRFFQSLPAVTGLSNGNFVVSWEDARGDSDSRGIRAQIFSATGSKLGGEFIANTQVVSSQFSSTVTALADGGFVISWVDFSAIGDGSLSSIKAQMFDATGGRVGTEVLVNSQTAGSQSSPTVEALANGGFVVTWTDPSGTLGDASSTSVKGQIFDAGGLRTGGEFLVNTQTVDAQAGAEITSLANGGFVVAWTDSNPLADGASTSVKAQVFGADGSKTGGEFLVNTQTLGRQEAPVVTTLSDGGFVIAWRDGSGTLGDASGSSIKAQAFSASGVPSGGEILINSKVENDQSFPTITALSDNRFVVSWYDFNPTLGNPAGDLIKAQIFAVTSVNSPPFGVVLSNLSVGEDAIVGSVIGVASASDGDSGDTLVFSLADDAGGRFAIDAATGVLSVAGPLDREAAAVHTVIITATDSGGLSVAEAFVIGVGDANEFAVTAPVDGDPAIDTVTENALNGAATGIAVTALDADATTNAVTFALVDDAGGRFAIDAATGVVSVADGSRLDHEAAATHAIVVRSTSADGSFADASFDIAIGDANEAPVIVSNGGGAGAVVTVAENAVLVGTVVGIDPDAGATLTYAIVGGADAARFGIDAASGVLGFVAAPDFETPGDADGDNRYGVVVSVSDGSLFAEQALTVAVTNVAEARSFVGTAGVDSFFAASDDNWTVDGLAGNDTLVTAGGADIIVAGGGNDVISAGGGDDIITFRGSTSANGFDLVDGGAGFDTLRALAANTSIGLAGVSGIELVTANGFANVGIVGSSAADRIDLGGATLIGITGIRAGSGNDVVIGTAGDDVISGEAGDDLLQGGDGNDVFRIGTGAGVDGFDGGAGFDTIAATAANARITPSSLSGIEAIDAAGFANVTIYGTAAANTIDLSGILVSGIAAIVAGSGDDIIIGSAAGDTIRGGAGADWSSGGGGSNVFDYDASSDSKTGGLADVIADFISGVDIIDLSTIDANTTVGANQAFIFIGDDAFSRTAGELRFDTSLAGVTRIFGDTNGNGAADFEIRLTGTIELLVADFIA